MKYRLQPRELDDMTLPYPYFIDENALVGRQDFWKGHPYKLLGFNSTANAGDIDVIKFLSGEKIETKDIKKGVGNYAVFSDASDKWFTLETPIELITEMK